MAHAATRLDLAMANESSSTSCPLLDLPPEILAMILEDVLRAPRQPIQLWDGNITEPAISMTCRVLREESLAVYYNINQFDMQPIGWDVLPFLHLWEQMKKYGSARRREAYGSTVTTGIPYGHPEVVPFGWLTFSDPTLDWEELKEWAFAYGAGRFGGPPWGTPVERRQKLAWEMIDKVGSHPVGTTLEQDELLFLVRQFKSKVARKRI